MIEHLQKLPPKTVEQFLSSRDAEALGIPPKLAEYILQLNEAANLLREHKYISECALKLKESYIDNTDATDKDKQRMIDEVERELNITDIPHEEIGN